MREDILKELYRHDEGLPDSMRKILERDELELPEGTMGTLHDIFRCGEDRSAYSERLGLAGVEGAQIGWGGGEPRINTYPFGEPCDDVFPEFVGVCAGWRKLEDVLDRALEQCENMSRMYSPELPKTVTILTNKWHDPKFQKNYDLLFLKYALKYNILITFWLVTDYGVTRIPFLARNRAEMEDLRCMGISVETDPKAARASLTDGSPCSYYYDAGTLRQYDFWKYEFDFAGRTCRCWDKNWRPSVHGEGRPRRIPAAALDRFAQAVQPILELPGNSYTDPEFILDMGKSEATIFGKHFRWQVGRSDPCYGILSKAFRELVAALK